MINPVCRDNVMGVHLHPPSGVHPLKMHPPLREMHPPLLQTGARVVFDPIKNYVLTTIHGQDLPHFAGFCHLAHFSVK